MKKTKILVPVLTIAGLGATIAPIAAMTSCSCNPPQTGDSQVTEDEWKAAFDLINYHTNHNVNYTYHCETEGGAVNEKQIDDALISDKKIVFNTRAEGADNAYSYFKWEDDTILGAFKNTDDGRYYWSCDVAEPISNMIVILLKKDSYNDFQYDSSKKAYVYDTDTIFKFENKKITSIKIMDSTITFSKYGETKASEKYIDESTVVDNIVENEVGSSGELICGITDVVKPGSEYVLKFDISTVGAANTPTFTFTKTGGTITKDDLDARDCFISSNKGIHAYSVDDEFCTWNGNVLTTKALQGEPGTYKTIYMTFHYNGDTDISNVQVKYECNE